MKVLTFGEIMLRLKAPNHERLFQSPVLEATFGGAEANVAVSLANFGMETAFLTVLPEKNTVSDACIRELRSFGVDVSGICFGPGRMGIYYLESGANQLPGKVVYDREGSSMAIAEPGSVNWQNALSGVSWLHLSGITPALSEHAMELSLECIHEAKANGITVSFDLNYRKNLWKYGKAAETVLPEFIRCSDIVIASEDEVQEIFQIPTDISENSGRPETEKYHEISDKILAGYPNVKMLAVILRESKSTDSNGWTSCLNDRKRFYCSRKYDIEDIVDRVGVGDSFAAGLICGLCSYDDAEKALEFAAAASCLKHSIPGDFNRVDKTDVEKLMSGNVTGRVQR